MSKHSKDVARIVSGRWVRGDSISKELLIAFVQAHHVDKMSALYRSAPLTLWGKTYKPVLSGSAFVLRPVSKG